MLPGIWGQPHHHPAPCRLACRAVHRDAWERRIAWEGVPGAHKLRCGGGGEPAAAQPGQGACARRVGRRARSAPAWRAPGTTLSEPAHDGPPVPPAHRAPAARVAGPAFDLNDPDQAFELTKPLEGGARPAALAAAAGAGAGGARAADLAAVVESAAALVIAPQSWVRLPACAAACVLGSRCAGGCCSPAVCFAACTAWQLAHSPCRLPSRAGAAAAAARLRL